MSAKPCRTRRRRLCCLHFLAASSILIISSSSSSAVGSSISSSSASMAKPPSSMNGLASDASESSESSTLPMKKKRRRREVHSASLASISAAAAAYPTIEVADSDLDDVDDAVHHTTLESTTTQVVEPNQMQQNATLDNSPKATSSNNGGLPSKSKQKRKRRRRKATPTDTEIAMDEVQYVEGVLFPMDDDLLKEDTLTIPEESAVLEEEEEEEVGVDMPKIVQSAKETVHEDSNCTDGNKDEAYEQTLRTKRKKRRRKNALDEEASSSNNGIVAEEVLLPIKQDDTLDAVDVLADSLGEGPLQSTEPASTSDMQSSVQSESYTKSINDEHRSDESSSLNVTRNETSESITLVDDTNEDAPTTYEYTKHNEEETVQGIVPTGDPDKETTASIHSSSQYENIHISGGGGGSTGQSVTVKVSRQRKQQTVHITNKRKDGNVTKKRKASSINEPKKAGSTISSTRSSTGKGGECLRRIKREWKDAVKMGIAYDWMNMKTIHKPNSSNTSSNTSNNNNYVRIGPYGKNLLRWHFSVLGPTNSPYSSGIYHGRVLLPKNYPGSPPRVQMLTPSGRFVCGADICLSASNYHPETWTPRWTVVSLVDALRLHMLTTANEIGGVIASEERRREYARDSRGWGLRGVVDHSRMVEEGIFSLPVEEEDGEVEDDLIVDDEDGGEVLVDELSLDADMEAGIGLNPLERSVNLPLPATQAQSNDLLESPHKKKKTDTKSAKASKQMKISHSSNNSQQQQTITTKKVKSKTAKKEVVAATKSKSNQQNTAKMAMDVEDAQKAEELHDMVSLLLKRIVVEMLKLPLRIISIVLRILSGVEELLTEILDSL